MRRAAREQVFKLVFEYTFYGSINEDTLDLMLVGDDLSDDDRSFISDTYAGITREEENLKAIISQNINKYRIERLYRPDLVTLMLAVYELERGEEPVAVIINEAVELSKKYGTDKSGGFVNGVLASVAKKMSE